MCHTPSYESATTVPRRPRHGAYGRRLHASSEVGEAYLTVQVSCCDLVTVCVFGRVWDVRVPVRVPAPLTAEAADVTMNNEEPERM